MKQSVIQIRLSPTEKTSIQKAAGFFGESISEFLRQAALFRLKQGLQAKEQDPFARALDELTRDQDPEELPAEIAKRAEEFRKNRPKPGDLLTPAQAMKLVRTKK